MLKARLTSTVKHDFEHTVYGLSFVSGKIGNTFCRLSGWSGYHYFQSPLLVQGNNGFQCGCLSRSGTSRKYHKALRQCQRNSFSLLLGICNDLGFFLDVDKLFVVNTSIFKTAAHNSKPSGYVLLRIKIVA